MRTLQLGITTIHFRDDDCVVTEYPDGAQLIARPQPTEEYEAHARELGYANGSEMNMEHDPLHTILAVWRGQQCSYTLWHTAHNHPPGNAESHDEERLVLTLQKVLNGKAKESALPWAATSRGLVSIARALLRGMA